MFRLTMDAKKYERALERMGKNALGKATAATLNAIAKGANIAQRRNLEGRLIVRGPYTIKSLKMYKASESRPIAKQNSVVGSISPYLAIHDKGGKVRGKRGRVAVPTNTLRGSDRRKRIAPSQRMNKLGEFGAKGGKFFRIKTGIYYRKSKRKIVRVRDTSQRSYRVKATRWHTDAVHKYVKTGTISGVFSREARKVLAELGAK